MTIKEIAKHANVSVATVSRFLNDGYVSEEKRKVIAQVIKDNDYTPSQAAAKLRGKSNEVVVIVQRVSSNTTSRFLEGIIKTCEKYNLAPTIHVVNFNLEVQDKYIKEAISRKVHAIVVYSYTEKLDYDVDNLYVIGQKSDRYSCIYSEGRKVFNELVSNVLQKQDVKEIKIFGIELLDVEFINRVAGSIEAANKFGIPFEILEGSFETITNNIKLKRGTYYISLTDAQAYQVISLANKQNLKVGEDIFISGYGNYNTSKMLDLTSVDGLYENIGEMVISLINKSTRKEVLIKPVLNFRNSTGMTKK